MNYQYVLSEKQDTVGLLTLNRPEALNALSNDLVMEMAQVLDDFESDPSIGAIVITGNEKAFAAGADIKGMHEQSFMDVYLGGFIGDHWRRPSTCRKPIIAAVAGFALGGGCELAMMCDIVIAAETARFGQPEIKLGIIPGAGGTQRLTRFVGKAKAMDLCLTARMMSAEEAERAGLVSRVVDADKLLDEALDAARVIASMSRPSVIMAKQAVNRAYETTLEEGIASERHLFHSLFATEDQKEGMSAFIEKRTPNWKHR